MTEISVSLVRKAHGNLDADSLMKLDIIQLNNYGIEEIDNLEVFEHIKELHLSGNRIKILENLNYLTNLEFLDVSNNNIDENGLKKVIGNLPSSLQTIVIGGNPCCLNDNILCDLNDYMPNLGIVIGLEKQQQQIAPAAVKPSVLEEYNEVENVESKSSLQSVFNKHITDTSKMLQVAAAEMRSKTRQNAMVHLMVGEEKDSDSINDNDIYAAKNHSDKGDDLIGTLDADEILKSIVERKCNLQNLRTSFNITDTVTSLNKECDAVMEDVSNRAIELKKKRGDINDAINDVLHNNNRQKTKELHNEDLNIMLQNSKVRSDETKDFLSGFKERIIKSRENAFEIYK
jgi:hypothetical protein